MLSLPFRGESAIIKGQTAPIITGLLVFCIALRVLVTRYTSYYTQADLRFIARMIRSIYPPQCYQGWLPIDW